MASAAPPSSHGSLDDEEVTGPRRPEATATGAGATVEDDDDFDSDDFREWMRSRRRERGSPLEEGRRNRRGDEEDSDDGPSRKSSGGPQPPEWDGESIPFQDWLAKCKLWLATTRTKGRAQGPAILQRLSGQPWNSFKHWAKDQAWLLNDQGAKRC